jgi:hypothetical protein
MPGITALAHISYRIDPAFLLSATGIYRWPEGPECLGYCSDFQFTGANIDVLRTDHEHSLVQRAEDVTSNTVLTATP